ncbi:putative integral membrane protein [Amylocarpus encephaloides]|uniref:Integral membrane protein n=1 Tax=Amylocarpus encephaloides TaxID=45428 RepID=A0A9P7YKA9_9HELO|nr:putative integral membrane protein [Amylocarpus encephaloides]
MNTPTHNLAENYQSKIYATIIPFAVLANLAIVLRFLSRKLQKLDYYWDDYLSLLGLLASPEDIVVFFKSLMAYEIIYFATLACTKVSILFLYRRLFPTRTFRIASNLVGALVLAWLFATILVSIFSCSPVSAFWTHAPGSKCIVSVRFYIGNAVPNIVTDFIILTLPIPVIWKLRTSLSERIALLIIFLLGGFVVIASIIRLTLLHEVQDPDFMWGFNNTVIWSSVEPSMAVISACLPTMRPLAEFILPKRFRRRNVSNYGHQSKFRNQFSNLSEVNPAPQRKGQNESDGDDTWGHKGDENLLSVAVSGNKDNNYLGGFSKGGRSTIRVDTDVRVSEQTIV